MLYCLPVAWHKWIFSVVYNILHRNLDLTKIKTDEDADA